uniref:Subtilisin-like protease SBT1.5 n=1 Tax=Elaeis guineensis var. tenera TaxID=51953 RepID=A0A6I9Q9G6_ELAGV
LDKTVLLLPPPPNVVHWVTTVGASSMDRDLLADIKLNNDRPLPGISIYGGPVLALGRLYPLIYTAAALSRIGAGAGDGYSSSLYLEGSLNPDAICGKIVICDRGVNSRATKGEVIHKADGVRMILTNGVFDDEGIFDGEGLVADCHVLPATAIGTIAGDEIQKYINTATPHLPPTATIFFHSTHSGFDWCR